MNIAGKKPGKNMVRFTNPEDYLFGTDYTVAEQRGICAWRVLARRGLRSLIASHPCLPGADNREIIGIRIENLPVENIERMHQFYLDLYEADRARSAKFNIALFPITNFLRGLLPTRIAERGNCARWTSKGLVVAGVATKPSMWPKSVWINIFENTHRTATQSPDNLRVVVYRRAKHAKLSYGIDAVVRVCAANGTDGAMRAYARNRHSLPRAHLSLRTRQLRRLRHCNRCAAYSTMIFRGSQTPSSAYQKIARQHWWS